MRKFLTAATLGVLAAVTVVAPAIASSTVIRVPEPGTLGLLTVGVGGAWLAGRYLRRK